MDRSRVVKAWKVWEPQESETLEGMFHLEGGLNWTVHTIDGTLWLLEAEAEERLEALDPEEGQPVQVIYVRDGFGEPMYHVNLV